MAGVKFQNVYKIYDNGVTVIKDLNLEIRDGEFLVLVGPSGCGKSTSLRMIAGLESISKGDLLIGDKRVNDVEPRERNIAMVFQNYALYPHLTVAQNMGFSLKMSGCSASEIDSKVKEAAKVLGLEPLLERKPKEMSGGQRQRVAIGRAIVRAPEVFLFDEPLSNLDAKLRVEMRVELAKLHRHLKTTMVYVTHDQVEAMTLADRIVVLKDGFIQQVGTPQELYDTPANTFVGSFIGTPSMNQIVLQLDTTDDGVKFSSEGVDFTWKNAQGFGEYNGKKVFVGIRPEDISLEKTSDQQIPVRTEVEVIEPMGNESFVYFSLGSSQWVARHNGFLKVKEGEAADIYINSEKLHFFSEDGSQRLEIKK